MADDLQALEDWLGPLLAKLTPQEQRSLARKVGQDLRRSQAKRIAAQQAPDGTAYSPRKPPPTTKAREKKGAIRKAMFAKMRTARHMKMQVTGEGVAVGFLGRTARIALVHQEGRADAVVPGGVRYRYLERRLLGLTELERTAIRDAVLDHLRN